MKALLLFAALLLACPMAAAQQGAVRPVKRPKAAHPHARAAGSVAIPQHIALPQEAFASLPEHQPAMSPTPSACDAQLAKIAAVRPLGALVAPGECGATDAVLLESVTLPDGSKVAITPPATLRCSMARQVAAWLRQDVAPAAMATLRAPLRGLENLGSYECRGRDRVRGATLSEHGRANALDVRSFKLGNGETVVLADPRAPQDFRDAVRTSACARFATVLGPGSDSDHAEHVHIDLAERRGGYKLCEWTVRVAAAQTQAAPILPGAVPLPRPRPTAASAMKRRSDAARR